MHGLAIGLRFRGLSFKRFCLGFVLFIAVPPGHVRMLYLLPGDHHHQADSPYRGLSRWWWYHLWDRLSDRSVR